MNDLVVHNPLDAQVLLYEGEEVLGAQQNRTFDVSALVAARSALQVPVSCVEAGRWDGARHDEAFVPAPQTANPRLRRMKNTQARASLAAGMEARAVQGEVWREVADTAGRHGVNSRTGAMHDVFERRREQLDAVARAVEMHCSQVGMLAAIGGRFVVLDHVSEVEAFAALHGPLVQGYALDALEAPERDAAVDRRRSRVHRAAARRPVHAGAGGRARRGPAVRVRRAGRHRPDLRGRARDADRVRGRAGTATARQSPAASAVRPVAGRG